MIVLEKRNKFKGWDLQGPDGGIPLKTKVKNASYEEVMALPREPHKLPRKPSIFLSTLIRALASIDLKQVDFSYTEKDMEKAGKRPWLILMNHSAFIDLEIAQGYSIPGLTASSAPRTDLWEKTGS